MKYDFLVLGGDGMQGRIVIQDLLERGYSVFAADLYKSRVEKLLKRYKNRSAFTFVDLRDVDMTIHVIQKSGADVVINAAEGDWNLNVYEACYQTGAHCLDLGSRVDMTKHQLGKEMQKKFKSAKRTAITGCGSVPGVGNVMLRYAARKFDALESVNAGFAWDSNIKKFVIPFSVESILEEFTLPAPYVKNGKVREKYPMETILSRHYRAIGNQRAFLADHPESYTFLHYYKKKGLKNLQFWAGFPEHAINVFNVLTELGFHVKAPVETKFGAIPPDAYLTQLLKRLDRPKGYKEWENLWVEIVGRKDRKSKKILMECIVPTLKGWEEHGCNIDTGIPMSVMAQMIKNGVIKKAGSFAPEGVVPEKEFFRELHKRKMTVYENGKIIN